MTLVLAGGLVAVSVIGGLKVYRAANATIRITASMSPATMPESCERDPDCMAREDVWFRLTISSPSDGYFFCKMIAYGSDGRVLYGGPVPNQAQSGYYFAAGKESVDVLLPADLVNARVARTSAYCLPVETNDGDPPA